MTFKKGYYYLFYKLYKLWSRDENPFLSNSFRAEVSLMVLKSWIIVGMYGYTFYALKLKPAISITDPIGYIPLMIILGSTLYFFSFSDKWKLYFEEFDKWPKSKNIKGGIVACVFVLFIFVNLFVSVGLLRSI